MGAALITYCRSGVLGPFLFEGQVVFIRDLLFYAVPSKAVLQQALEAREFPLWNPFFWGAACPFLPTSLIKPFIR